MKSATALAQIAGGAPVTDIEQVRADADLYVVSVKDSVLGELLPRLCKGKETKVFLHTAGSMDMNVFALHFLFPVFPSRKQTSPSQLFFPSADSLP